jgi:hypothetical protein
MIRTKETLT